MYTSGLQLLMTFFFTCPSLLLREVPSSHLSAPEGPTAQCPDDGFRAMCRVRTIGRWHVPEARSTATAAAPGLSLSLGWVAIDDP